MTSRRNNADKRRELEENRQRQEELRELQNEERLQRQQRLELLRQGERRRSRQSLAGALNDAHLPPGERKVQLPPPQAAMANPEAKAQEAVRQMLRGVTTDLIPFDPSGKTEG